MVQNPFIVQRPIKYGEPFCDRRAEIGRLLGACERAEAVCILSIRRFGKTSLVNQVLGRLEAKNWLTVRLDLSRCYSIDALVRDFEVALRVVQGGLKKIMSILKGVSRIRPQITIDPVTSQPGLGFNFSRPVEDFERLRSVLAQLVSFPEKAGHGIHLCLVLDEFQYVRKIDPRGRIEWTLRAAFQERCPSFVPIMLGSEQHLLQMMVLEESAAFFKGVTPMGLDVLPEDEVAGFVTQQFWDTLEHSISEGWTRGVWRLFGGHPYAINWFFSELWSLEGRSATLEPLSTWVDVAVRIILNQREYYEAINNRLSMGARKLLRAIAAHEPVARIFSKEFMVDAVHMAQGSIQSALRVLLQEDKVKKTPGGYVLADPLERLALAVEGLDEEALKGFVEARITQA